MEIQEELRQLKDIYFDYEVILRQEELIKSYIQHVLINDRDVQLSLMLIPLPAEQKQINQAPAFLKAETFNLEALLHAFQNQGPMMQRNKPEIDRLFIPTRLTASIIKMLVEHIENSKKELETELSRIKEEWTQK